MDNPKSIALFLSLCLFVATIQKSTPIDGASVPLVPAITKPQRCTVPADSTVPAVIDGASVPLVPAIIRPQRRTAPADSTDAETGLALDPNLMLVKAHCTGCHSPKFITNTRLKRDEWQERIRWMQRNHKLWDLGEAEKTVLDYLEKHYSPSKTAYSRREALRNVKWYRYK